MNRIKAFLLKFLRLLLRAYLQVAPYLLPFGALAAVIAGTWIEFGKGWAALAGGGLVWIDYTVRGFQSDERPPRD